MTDSAQATVYLIRNPWGETISDDELYELICEAAVKRADSIAREFDNAEYPRDSMGFIILDPTAPMSRPSEDCVLAIITIGPNGADFVPNAAAKAFEHRDSGVECGVLVYTQPHRLADGDFRYGFSVCVDGTYVGGSGLSEVQDRREGTKLAADFNYGVGAARKLWTDAVGSGHWFDAEDQPSRRYHSVMYLSAHHAIRGGEPVPAAWPQGMSPLRGASAQRGRLPRTQPSWLRLQEPIARHGLIDWVFV
jgi:hypothetical protein